MRNNESFLIFLLRSFQWFLRKIYSTYISLAMGTRKARFDFGVKVIGSKSIRIGSFFYSGRNLWLESIISHDMHLAGKIIIHNSVSISDNTHIAAIQRVEIHDKCLIGSNVLITDHNHGNYDSSSLDYELPPNERPIYSQGPTVIEECCWIGDGARILTGVTVGRNSIVAANSVVTKNVAPYTIVAGIPAKVIKDLRGKNA